MTVSRTLGSRREKRMSAMFPIRLGAWMRPSLKPRKAVNVSRSRAMLKDVPAKLSVGDIIGLTCNGKKYRFRVVWTAKTGSAERGNVGLQSLDSGE
jgi:hypothetical protein